MSRRLKFKLRFLPIIVIYQRILRIFGTKPIPPVFLRRLVTGRASKKDFIKGADLGIKSLVSQAKLTKSSKVLDIGCGCGAAAISYKKWLGNGSGSYEGFDIYPEFIYWCREMIENYDSRFHFRLANIYNMQYNPKGTIAGEKYQFMYPENFFDLVFAWSVFTHLREADVINYLQESSRVLKPGGYLWLSYFLRNIHSEMAIKSKKSLLNFSYKQSTHSWSQENVIPETAMLYDESWLIKTYTKLGFKVTKIDYGNWVKKPDIYNFQDIVIAQKQ